MVQRTFIEQQLGKNSDEDWGLLGEAQKQAANFHFPLYFTYTSPIFLESWGGEG